MEFQIRQTYLGQGWYLKAPSIAMHQCPDGITRISFLPGHCNHCRVEMPVDAMARWNFFRRAAWKEGPPWRKREDTP